jgi:predicted RNA polymerase sigma factor
VRNDAVRAQPPHLVGPVILEVAREPFDVAVALERENVRGDAVFSAAGGWPVNGAPPFSLPDAGDSTAVRLSAPGAVRHDVAHQVAHVVLQISDDVLDDVSDRDHAHDLARVQHW